MAAAAQEAPEVLSAHPAPVHVARAGMRAAAAPPLLRGSPGAGGFVLD